MNRRSFFKVAAGVLAGALGAGWLWSRKPDDWRCESLRRHFAKRVWPPYTVDVCHYRNHFQITISVGRGSRAPSVYWALPEDKIASGDVESISREFDDYFSRLRQIVANGSLETGVQA